VSILEIISVGFHVHDIYSWDTDINLCAYGLQVISNSVTEYSRATIILFSKRESLPHNFRKFYENNGEENISSPLTLGMSFSSSISLFILLMI
jgi:hypothetical protein